MLVAGALTASDPVPAPEGYAFDRALDLAEKLADRGPEFEVPPSKLARALETVAKAEAWPETWLVLQDRSRTEDLIVHVRLAEGGAGVELDDAVVVPRREDWEHRALRDAVRAATGRKPRAKVRNVVVQGFRERTEHRFVYAGSSARRDRGVLALLPEDAILRDSRRLETGTGESLTLALAVVGPVFLPSDCACGAASLGHADAGRILAVLAGKDGIVARLDLTPWLSRDGIEGKLPRYACEPGDGDETAPGTVRAWFRERAPVPLLEGMSAPDGDGGPVTLRLPVERDGCSAPGPLLEVDPAVPGLRVQPRPER